MCTGISHSKAKLQAIESLQELSNTSPDQRVSNGRQRPSGIKVPKQSLLSSTSQTLSPRTPCQHNSSDSKRCVNCQCTSTPLWRKDKSSGLLYCNACGIYFKNHGKHRPLELIEGLGQPKLQQLPSGATCSCCPLYLCTGPVNLRSMLSSTTCVLKQLNPNDNRIA